MRRSGRRIGNAAALLTLLLAPSPAGAHERDRAAPLESEGDGGEPAEGGAPELFDPWELARAAGWMLAPEPSPSSIEDRAEAALEGFLDARILDDRIASGDVDGWYYDSARAMRREFRPDRQAFERERTAGMSTLQRGFDYLNAYANGPERPMDLPGQPPPELRAMVTDPTDRRQAIEQEAFDWCNPLNAPVRWYEVVIRVTHNPEGVLSAAWVERSSGYDTLDDAALGAARDGSVDLRPPPSGVIGPRQAIQADWLFELGVVHLYPNCAGACVDDPDLGLLCGEDIIRRRMRLLRVVDAAHQTAAERRFQRRRIPYRVRP